MSFHVPNEYRVRKGMFASDESYGNCGAFLIQQSRKEFLHVIASSGMGWEHVSVSREDRIPNWREMCFIKNMFWDDEDCVIQYHPPKSQYVNDHKYVLHLWKPIGIELPMPPLVMV